MINAFKLRQRLNRININIHGNKMPEDNEFCNCLYLLLLSSFAKIDNGYYRGIFLKTCKYAVKKKNITSTINEELNLDESDDKPDHDNSSESD